MTTLCGKLNCSTAGKRVRVVGNSKIGGLWWRRSDTASVADNRATAQASAAAEAGKRGKRERVTR